MYIWRPASGAVRFAQRHACIDRAARPHLCAIDEKPVQLGARRVVALRRDKREQNVERGATRVSRPNRTSASSDGRSRFIIFSVNTAVHFCVVAFVLDA